MAKFAAIGGSGLLLVGMAQTIQPLGLWSMVILAAVLSGCGAMARAARRGVRGWGVVVEGITFWLLAASLALAGVFLMVEYSQHLWTTYAISGGLGLLPWIGPEVWDRIGDRVIDRLGRFFTKGGGSDGGDHPK